MSNLSEKLAARAKSFWVGFTMLVAAMVVSTFAEADSEKHVTFATDVDKRVALVIGNGDYKFAPRLENPTFDARAVTAAFRRLGFDVVEGYDLDIAEMRGKLLEFSAKLPGAKSAVIFYSGHGVSVDDDNYIIPTDINLRSPSDLDLNALDVSVVLKQMKREDRVNIVILDACRVNPFAEALARNKTRSVVGERGLSKIDGELSRGTLIAFASDPKSVALDGSPGMHSPFTAAFLAHVEDPGVPIGTVMDRVRTAVWESTEHKQMPWVNTSLIGEYDLNPKPAPPPPVEVAALPLATGGTAAAVATPDRQAQENLMWQSAEHSNAAADYQAYLDAFPNGLFAPMARNRIAALASASTNSGATDPQSNPWPAMPSETELKAEIGTAPTEKLLNLSTADIREIQTRLTLLEYYKGPATGAFDAPTRAAVLKWQEGKGVTQTGMLGPVQLQALRAESESQYRRFEAAQKVAPVAIRSAPVGRQHEYGQPHHHVQHYSGSGSDSFPSFMAGVMTGVMGGLIVNHRH